MPKRHTRKKKEEGPDEEVRKPKKHAKKASEEEAPTHVLRGSRPMSVGGIIDKGVTKRSWEDDAPWNRKSASKQESRFERGGFGNNKN